MCDAVQKCQLDPLNKSKNTNIVMDKNQAAKEPNTLTYDTVI